MSAEFSSIRDWKEGGSGSGMLTGVRGSRHFPESRAYGEESLRLSREFKNCALSQFLLAVNHPRKEPVLGNISNLCFGCNHAG